MSLKKLFANINKQLDAERMQRYRVAKQWASLDLCYDTEIKVVPELWHTFYEYIKEEYGIIASPEMPKKEIFINNELKYTVFLLKYGHAEVDEYETWWQ